MRRFRNCWTDRRRFNIFYLGILIAEVQETEPDPDLRFFTVLVFLCQQGTIAILIQETGQGLFGGIRHNRADGIRITEGRIEDTPPVVSFSAAYGDPHSVISAAGKYHVAVCLGGKIVLCDFQCHRMVAALVRKPFLGHGFDAGLIVFQPGYEFLFAGAVRYLAVDIVQDQSFKTQLKSLILGAVAFRQYMETKDFRGDAGSQGLLPGGAAGQCDEKCG